MRASPAGGLCPAHATKPKPFAVAPTVLEKEDNESDKHCKPLKVGTWMPSSGGPDPLLFHPGLLWGCQLGLHFRISWESLAVKFLLPRCASHVQVVQPRKRPLMNHSHYASA